jgi:transposase
MTNTRSGTISTLSAADGHCCFGRLGEQSSVWLTQSGGSSRQGAITKTGSGLARRLLAESAWHYAREPRIGATLENRQQGQPEAVLQIANAAQQRIHRVCQRMKARGKGHHVTVVACARELGLLPLGRRNRSLSLLHTEPWVREAGASAAQRPARANQL